MVKVGDIVKLKSLNIIKNENECTMGALGINIDSFFINNDMFHMFGKKWEVMRTFTHEDRTTVWSTKFDFELKDNRGTVWKFLESWVDKDIMEIDAMFEDIEL